MRTIRAGKGLAAPAKLAVTTLIVLLACPWFLLHAAPTNSELPPPPAVAEKERLIAEILELDARLHLLAQEKAQAEARLNELRAALTATAREKDRLAGAIAQEQQDVALWLRFLAEDGTLTYLDVLLGAADLRDFLQRLDLIFTIIESNIRRLERLRDLARTATAKEEDLARQEKELAAVHTAIAINLTEAERLRQAKAAALARAEEELSDFNAVLAAARAWETVLPDIDGLLSHLAGLPWEKIQPDSLKVDFFRGEAHLAYREDTLAALLNEGRAPEDKVEPRCASGSLILTRPARGTRPAYILTLALEPDGRRLLFRPLAVSVAGVDVPAPTLGLLFAGHDLALNLPLPAGLKIAAVAPAPGELSLTLTN